MSRLLRLLVAASLLFAVGAQAAEPLRVFIRGGKKTHGPNAHEHERFMNDWKALLNERGAKADGALDWPTAEQFQSTDVVVAYAEEAGDATPEQQKLIEEFTKRGGGIVVIHSASVAMKNSAWWKSIIGGSWVKGQTKWKEGPMDLYYVENERLGGGHPITKDAANFHLDDEIYYDMDISPDVRVLATSYTPNVPAGKKAPEGGKATIYDIQPQMWAYEKDNYRAFVSIPGHLYGTFEKPNYRAILLRGIAWVGKRTNLDELCKPEEISSLTYPEGGPQKPEQTLANLEVHPDFTMTLVAAEPLITKPMNFDWDAAGRMWVAETPEYPNGRRGMRPDYRGKEWKDHGGIDPQPGVQERKGRDKISILTDTNGDGVMDKKEVFYEGLDLVTGLVFHQDGVIVTQAPDILFLRDTDGDGKCDKVEKLYTGLGTSDTHAVINNPRWGWDGWIYATHGYSASPKVTNGDGSKNFGGIGSGVVRFKPDGSAIEQYSSKGGNTWGLTITGDNRVMWTQPTSSQLLMQTLLPEGALARGKVGKTASFNVVEPSRKAYPLMTWEQLAYVQIDLVGSFTAAAGTVIYDGGAWPAEYNGDYFCTEPTINIIHHTRLKPEGSSYSTFKLPGREETEFVRSRDMWWRPIEVRVGPDGAMYVGDFYNQAVIHNDTRGPDHNKVNAAVRPDRDHYFGRIWKIEHKDAAKIRAGWLAKNDARGVQEAKGSAGAPPAVPGASPGTSNVAAATNSEPDVFEKLGVSSGALKKVGRAPAPPIFSIFSTRKLVPDLSRAGTDELIKQLGHPNRVVRMNASRLLVEQVQAADEQTRKNVGFNFGQHFRTDYAKMSPEEKIAAMWTLWRIGRTEQLYTPVNDADASVRRNGLQIMELVLASVRAGVGGDTAGQGDKWDDLTKLLADPDPQVRLALLRAMGALAPGDVAAAKIVTAWPTFTDDYQRSAAIGALSLNPTAAIAAALDDPDPAPLAPVVGQLTQLMAEKQDATAAAKLVIALAGKPTSADALKRSILDTLGRSLTQTPPMTPELSAALEKLLSSGASGAVLPLAAKWDTSGALKGQISQIADRMMDSLFEMKAKDETRLASAQSLLGLRRENAQALPAVAKLLGSDRASAGLQKGIVAALSETNDPAAGAAIAKAFSKLPPDVQTTAFDTLLKRADWTLAFLDAVKARQVDVTTLGPANAFRLRTHPDKAVSDRATAMLDELNPAAKMKNEIIAKLQPVVESKGNAENGKAIFTATCAVCHKFGDIGADIGPVLTGMGSHGPGELLTAIVDPNREVDPSFVAWNIETNDGQFANGVIARENPSAIVLRSLVGEQEVKVASIKTRVNTGRSLMPEGFDALGGEAIRDIIAFMQSADGGRFRTLDLSKAFTANTKRGLYVASANVQDTLKFAKTGPVSVEGVPFTIVGPDKAASNVVVLKGGPPESFAKTLAQRVEVPVGGFTANRLHFLGGVAGWGAPYGDDNAVVMRVFVQFADGKSETLEMKNGVEFADYIREVDVPGSTITRGLVKENQLRWFSKKLSRTGAIDKLVLESTNIGVAPTTVAITAELADPNAPLTPAATGAADRGGAQAKPMASAAGPIQNAADAQVKIAPEFNAPVPQPPAQMPANGPRVLLVGGGSSHDFPKFFGAADIAILKPQVGWVDFTQNANGVAPILANVDVLVWSANQPLTGETRKALADWVAAGKPLILLHPGLWYNWPNFPEYNRDIAGGGARGHDKFGEFETTVTNRNHPITAGLPEKFRISDELYYFTPDAQGTPIEVLATATSTQKPGTYPQVFVVKHPKARIVGITLGHDAKAHDLPEFQALLKNAVKWVSGK